MGERGRTVALVVAGGSGERARGAVPKQYRPIGGKPVLRHAIERLSHPRIDAVRVVTGEGHERLYREAVAGFLAAAPILGGSSRQRSVRNGLEAIAADGGAARILIHDAARPFLPAQVVDRLLGALEGAAGAVPVLPVVDSLAVGAGTLGDTVDRSRLLRVQTPQAFGFDAILAAHRAWPVDADATDDAQVARAAGFDIATVQGDGMLDKLTYEADFAAAEQRLASGLVVRTGMGFDVHAFAAGEELWLGGVRIPHERGLKGHSDADVALHALTDAILGAIGEGDIGDHFPPSDPQWRGAASSRFVEHARNLVEAKGGRIDHADITIICEAPRIGPHRLPMRQAVAALLRLPLARISIKATTTERLGFTGRGEGMAAQAVVTIRMPEEE